MYNENDALNEFMARLQRPQLEERLDKMWENYGRGIPQQLKAYNQQVDDIKSMGAKVLRNSKGKHKIVFGDKE